MNTAPLATVERTGLVTVQDLGRAGLSGVGVPISGAWHRGRHRLAVALAHGSGDDTRPSLEIINGSFSLLFHEPQVIAVVGAAEVRIDGQPVPTEVALHVLANSRLDIDHRGSGPVHLAVSGWQPLLTLGSAATDTFSSLGGHAGDGTAITRRYTLVGHPVADTKHVGAFLRPGPTEPREISVVLTTETGAEALCGEPWSVTSTARSGTRLKGPSVPAVHSISSMPVVPGALQLVPDGTVIVLGPDGGLTGGYPVVGVIASLHLDRIADLALGEEVRFSPCDPVSAYEAFTSREKWLATAVIRPDALT
jgi:allophanate hydrolase subunit 2